MNTVVLNNVKDQSNTRKESLRAIRTNIQFSGVEKKAILVTSSAPNEGKSTVSFELAESLAESGKRVLFIDTDMRKSVIEGRLRAKSNDGGELKGLSHYLSGQEGLENVMYYTNIPMLFMIFAGRNVLNPTEILDTRYFEALIEFGKSNFDYIIIDCPPLGAAIDAAIVAKYCDGAILVVAQGGVNRRVVVNSIKQLEATNTPILGVVLNKVQMKKNGYGKYYGGYYGGYYGNYYKS